MEKNEPPSTDEEWIEISNRLLAFAEDQISMYSWYRGHYALPQGFTSKDFVQETILRYLDNTAAYDPEKGDFLLFLKYFLLQRLVSNLSKRSENKKGSDIFRLDSEDEEGVLRYEDYLPVEILDIDSEIDLEKITYLIIEQIDGELILEKVFEGIYMNNLKRRETCEQYKLSDKAYDNAVRRLNTIIKTVKFLIT